MKLLILYRPDSEYGRIVEEFIHDYQMRHETNSMQVLNIDSREGDATAQLYGLMQFPAILATRDDGSLLKGWTGPEMPLMDEVASYTYS